MRGLTLNARHRRAGHHLAGRYEGQVGMQLPGCLSVSSGLLLYPPEYVIVRDTGWWGGELLEGRSMRSSMVGLGL